MIKVLIVDDDPMVAELNRRYVEQLEGFAVAGVARSGDEALMLLEKQEIDLVLLDIFMPGVNGLEVLVRIRSLDKSVDVIVVTAASDIHSVKKASRYGAVDYLIKPFEFSRLKTALTAYRNRVNIMRRPEAVKQAELDRFFFSQEQPIQLDLFKGLDRNTLRKVWESIQTVKGRTFTTEEMAILVGISRVSMRKYLDFLKQLEVLKVEMTYGSVGRPVYKYQCVDLESKVIRCYL